MVQKYYRGLCFILLTQLQACGIDGLHTNLNQEEKDWIAQHREVEVYLLRTTPVLRNKSGEVRFRGIEYYYLKHIERQTGLRFKFTLQPSAKEWVTTLASSKPPMLASVNQDTISQLSLNKNYYFTQPYSTQSLMVISRRNQKPIYNANDLQGLTLAFIFNDNSRSWMARDGLNVSFYPVDTSTMTLRSLVDMKADIALVPETYARFMLNHRFPELKSSGSMPGYYAIYSFGISKSQPLLYRIIQKTMDNMTADDVDDVRTDWENEIATRPTAYTVMRTYAGEGAILLLAFFLLLWTVRRANILMRKAQMGEEAKSEFLAVISHEIRTPMNAIIAAGELLHAMPMSEKQHQLVVQSNLAANSLLQLLNNILSTSRLDAGQETLELSFVDAGNILNGLSTLYRLAAETKGLQMHYATELPSCTLLLDPSHLQRVLHNLLSNAIKFTKQGSITLQACFRMDSAKPTHGMLICRVSDTGIGIKEEAQKAVFSPFVQADPSINRQFGGSGLGLAISKRLVELMKGRISLYSDGHSRTTFTIEIPTEIGGPLNKEPIVPLGELSGSEIGYNQRVLVIEDHPANQQLIRDQLLELGCEVSIASNGMSGLSILRELSDVKLILLDCHLPDVNGYEVAQRIRAEEKAENLPLTPIIAISATNDYQHQEKCMSSGMNGLLVKPLRLADLQKILSMWLTDVSVEKIAKPPSSYDANLWDLFIEYNEADFAGVDSAIKQQQWDVARQHAHRIYGLALSMDVPELVTVAGKLEQLLVEHQVDALAPALAQLRAALDAIAKNISEGES
ncbi:MULTISPECIES: ATP-binding protein [Chromobacterium]|uniref:ATP-binding protein n=1 Tax=Chromobacterium TaxID=535 RepID=UPI0018877CA8|nr:MULTISPECIES: ATP-binding protein [Chromobacterium]QOZ84477.1 response regulator [Chromobacterium sp. Rain0013]WON86049.1 ATP-binding protein [Chromobacterium haemolyticum]